MPQGTKSAVTTEARRLTPAQQRAAEIEAQEQRRAQQETEADELASEIEGLVEEFVERHGEKLSSSMERQIAAFRHETDAVVREVTRAQLEDVALAYNPDKAFSFGDAVACKGGVWRCAARRGAAEGEVPGPDSAAWILLSDGIADVEIDQTDADQGRITITLVSQPLWSGPPTKPENR